MNNSFKVKIKIDTSSVRKIAIGNSQDRGARNYQEDSFGYTPLDSESIANYGFTAVVADGMGGMACGEQISSFAVSSIIGMRGCEGGIPPHIHFTRVMNDINRSVADSGIGGGCTVAAVMCTTGGIYWCSVGDSRVYLYRNEELCSLTEDSDYMNVLFDKVLNDGAEYNEISADPQKDSLAEYIGYRGSITPDVNIRPLIPQKKDRILICSDGVYNALSNEELSCSLILHAQAAADDIRNKILMKNYANQDNFTSIVLEFI